MYVALEQRIRERPLSPAASGPPDPTRRVTVTFASGRQQLANAKAKRRWPDGKPLGQGHAAPYLQPVFAAAIATGRKLYEGRPGGGWVRPANSGRLLAPDDYVRFKVSGHTDGLCVHVLSVKSYPTFAAMINDIGVTALLPDADGADVAGAVATYRAFGNRRGTFGALEAAHGAVAIGVQPLAP